MLAAFRIRSWTTAVAVLLLVAGCRSPLGLEPAPPGEQLRAAQNSALTSDTLAIRTVQVLERDGIAPVATEETAAALRNMAINDIDCDRLVALAEVSYALARRYGFTSDLGWQHATVAATASWAALFGNAASLSPFQSRAMLARQLHNVSMSAVVLGIPDLAGSARVELHRTVFGHDLVIRVAWEASTWDPALFVGFVPADDYRVRGLRNRHRQSGVGAPLLGERGPIDRATADAATRRLPPTHQSVALTAVVRDVRSAPGEQWIPETLDIAIFDPARTPTVTIAGHEVPLESDSSAALANTLGQNEPLRQAGLGGLFRVTDWQEIGGLYMLEPFDPNRIPVIFVHGLVSSPLTWREMVNDLESDPAVGSRFQFWFFLYPTGQPFALSAAALRNELDDVRRVCDPEGTCAALDQIVLIGHSMGGLVSRLLVTDPGTALWDSLSPVPIDQAALSDADREIVTRAFLSPPVRGVTRVVFLAVPHRGSNLADRTPGRLASRLVQLPPSVLEAAGRVFQSGDSAKSQTNTRTISNGIDSLSPQSPFLRTLADLPIAPGVTAHSIIGDRTSTPGPNGTDGVVPYSSSHLEGVESELVIPNADHSLALHPEATREVRRILREHAAISSSAPRPSPAPSGGATLPR
ncbi:MAG: alpha/beta fold hydrolase [Phycisphaerales bacterium]